MMRMDLSKWDNFFAPALLLLIFTLGDSFIRETKTQSKHLSGDRYYTPAI